MSEFHSEAGAAGRGHSTVAPELRQLAQSILDRLDPAIRLAAARAQAGGPGKCEQVWCPVCALAALISGEQHPLLSVVAEHSVGLLALVKAMLADLDGADPRPPEPDGPSPDDPTPPRPTTPSDPGRYQHITVIVEE
ncbi:hypothetical protein [Mycolicibacterium hippocampi]|uniref:Uncharacterized protein n=1 Tax=Mycolicibacterium hippocampi TaxID=659824 RepID=A0A850PVX4_9MYCO|nr:hypothetical protein [Mycolicibacterium hippocampi]NVN51775.1 hypothetical protein [Mycolicibacterium hippocampi]